VSAALAVGLTVWTDHGARDGSGRA